MPVAFERPVTALATPSLRARQDRSRARDRASEKATVRWNMTRLAAATVGSLNDKLAAVEGALRAGLIERVIPLPSKATLSRWLKQWARGERCVEDYEDDYRAGRPLFDLAPALAAMIDGHVDVPEHASVLDLYGTMKRYAKAAGVPCPNYRTVLRLVGGRGRLRRSAARHGRRAASMDGVQHLAVYAAQTHDCWVLDELTAPVWLKQYDNAGIAHSIKVDVVLIVDYASRATPGYFVVDPSRRLDEKGEPMRRGFDTDDVLAALFSAAIPELAPAATRRFAGKLPRVLRWDNAKQHGALRERLQNIGILVPVLPGRKPNNRGVIERKIGTLKRFCAGMHGFADRYHPTDQPEPDQADVRTTAAAAGDRHVRRTPVDPEQLMSVEEFREEFDNAVRRYNEEHVHSAFRRPVAALYNERMDRFARDGRDLLYVLPVRTALVEREGGIAHPQGNRVHFFPAITGTCYLQVDTQVSYRADPVCRALFADVQLAPGRPPQTVVFESMEEVARKADPHLVGRTHHAVARFFSRQAASVAEVKRILELGARAAAAADRAHAQAVAKSKHDAASGDRETGAPPADAPPPNAPAGPAVAATATAPAPPRDFGFVPSFAPDPLDRAKRPPGAA